jgi:hypothetical protein
VAEVVVLGLGVADFGGLLLLGSGFFLGGEVVEKGGKGLVFFVGFGEDEGGGAVGVGVVGWGVGVAVLWSVGQSVSSEERVVS